MSDKKLLIKAVITATLCQILFAVVLMCLCSAVILTAGLLPEDILPYIMLAIIGFSSMLGGFIASRITKSAGLIVGAITGFVAVFIVSLLGIIKGTDQVTILTPLRLAITIICGAFGGAIGVNKKDKLHIK
jgi:putative membrane protein (TIGR04086 family)